MRALRRSIQSLCLLAGPLAVLGSAQFTRNTTHVPTGNIGYTENVDFGDVDLDGDWDIVLADGGDFGNQQNRVWVNQGGAQGGTLGFFADETSTRFPAVLSDARDIEFADFDLDGDLDLHTSTTSTLVNQPSRWWINMGGLQGGSPGFYQDQTAARWVNLGVNNGTTTFSSMPPGQVLGGGGFLDWCCDSDFGDLDNDGDPDLVHSSYGPAFNGNVPTRMFMNDGFGNFEEFNPSGFQMPGATVVAGQPGIWAMGTQQSNTLNATGLHCDIASDALDIDVGDVDGDLDLDLLHGARGSPPRIFQSLYQENNQVLGFFIDTTGAWFPPGYSTGNGHYEQEFGDLDNDGDLDIYGLNWLVGGFMFNDCTLQNTGNGFYANVQPVVSSASDDNEADVLDYDQDGDLDVLIANYAGQDRLYRNDLAGGNWTLAIASGQLPLDNTNSLDADACDVDEDGDTDAFVANGNNQAEWYLQNQSSADDTFAPVILRLEQAPNRVASTVPSTVRAQIYDNTPYYVTGYVAAIVEASVNGQPFVPVPMRWSGGQVFRAEIPGTIVGQIDYRVRARDKSGNVGFSTVLSYSSGPGACTGAPANYCAGKVTSAGCTAAITWDGVPSATAGAGFAVLGINLRKNQPGVLLYGTTGRASVPFSGGTLCVAAPVRRSIPVTSSAPPAGNDCSGVFFLDMNRFAQGLSGGSPAPALRIPGTVVDCQYWGRDNGFPAPNNTMLTNALESTVCP